MSRRALRAGALLAVLAGLIWSVLPVPDDQIAQQRPASTPASEEGFLVAEVLERTGEAPVIAAVDDAPPPLDAPEFVTTHEPMAEPATPFLGEDLGQLPLQPNPFDVPAGPGVPALPPMIGAVPPGGSGAPGSSAPPSRGTPPIVGGPGGGLPITAGPARPPAASPSSPSAGPAPDDKGPILGGPKPQVATLPDAPASDPAPGGDGPSTAGPVTPPAAPTVNGPTLFDLPDQLPGPVIGSTGDPVEDWFSPGHSPGIADIDGPFALDGGTLLFEIMGTKAGTEYDQLIVHGDVDLNAGNVVIAFIGGYVPENDQVTDIFDLILAANITVDQKEVEFYYGFFDDPWLMHAPTDLAYYSKWIDGTVLSIGVEGEAGDQQLRVAYNGVRSQTLAALSTPESQPFTPLAIPVPVPAPLLLMAAGLLLISRLRRH